MVKELSCQDMPTDVVVKLDGLSRFASHGSDFRLTEVEAKRLGWLIEDGEPTVAHTQHTYRKPNDFSRIDYPVVAPVYTRLEEKLVTHLNELYNMIHEMSHPGCGGNTYDENMSKLRTKICKAVTPHLRMHMEAFYGKEKDITRIESSSSKVSEGC